MDDVDKRSAFAKGGPEGVDIVWSTVDSAASEFPDFARNGVRARVIMQVDWSRGADAIVADKSITKIEDLVGRKVSVTKSSPSQWLLEVEFAEFQSGREPAGRHQQELGWYVHVA